MAAPHDGNWHTGNGRALPFRPPTVDEALAYSPFASVLPFSPDIIPFPSAEPPTTQLFSSSESNAAKRAIDILSAELAAPSQSHVHLEPTLHKLQDLLNPNELSQFQFKPITQLATPPPDGPSTFLPLDGTLDAKEQPLSAFAEVLLKNTAVSYLHSGIQPVPNLKREQSPLRKPTIQPSQVSQTAPKANGSSNAASHHNSQPKVSSPATTTTTTTTTVVAQSQTPGVTRPGPAVMIKTLAPSSRREDYQKYDEVPFSDDAARRKRQEELRADNETFAMRSDQQEIVNRKVRELINLVKDISTAKDDDEQDLFSSITPGETEFKILKAGTLKKLANSVTSVTNTGFFETIPIKQVLRIQSLCEPSVTSVPEISLDYADASPEEWLARIADASAGLRAGRLIVQTMTAGAEEKRLCSEDLVQSIVGVLRHFLHRVIVPVVESRPSGGTSDLFEFVSRNKESLWEVLRLGGVLLALLGTLIGKIRLTETVLTPIEYLSTSVIFIQNADREKESALGVQKFEVFRRKAMDVLAQIFACHVDQRSFVLTEILSNTDKLPTTPQSARQFKLAQGSPIMLISALFMRFVHAAASTSTVEKGSTATQVRSADVDDDDSEDELGPAKQPRASKLAAQKPVDVVTQLRGDATNVANKIVSHLVNRALNVSKTGDKPFRAILDFFVEDVCQVFGSPEWPAADLLLSRLALWMMNLVAGKGKDVTINDKAMALNAVAVMACGVTDFMTHCEQMMKRTDTTQSDLSAALVRLGADALQGGINPKDLLGFKGPYPVLVESLPAYLNVTAQDDPHLRSVIGCQVTFWAHSFIEYLRSLDAEEAQHSSIQTWEQSLMMVAVDPKQLSTCFNITEQITPAQSRLAAGIVTLQSTSCKLRPRLIMELSANLSNSSANLKARSMKGLTQLMEKNPETLGQESLNIIAHTLQDKSSLVRADALSLVSTCLAHNPSTEGKWLDRIIQRVMDPTPSVKKKAIKLLKDMYLGTKAQDVRLKIASALLSAVDDDDKGVSELTRQTFEDIWLSPFQELARTNRNELKLNRVNQVALLVQTVQRIDQRPAALEAFESFYKGALSSSAKNAAINVKVCNELVADMFEGVIGNDSIPGVDQRQILRTLSMFAKVSPKLFTQSQVQLLKPYVGNIRTTDELDVFQSTVKIFRYVFPSLPSLQDRFLEEVRYSLQQNVGTLAKPTIRKDLLGHVAYCLWAISPLVKANPQAASKLSGVEKLFGLIISVIQQLKKTPNQPGPEQNRKIKSYCRILGAFGQVCDLDQHVDAFKAKAPFKDWRGSSVSVLLLETILPFTSPTWDSAPDVQAQALESIGQVCQKSPKQFMRADVENAFKLVFRVKDDMDLKRVVLSQFREFCASEERRSETGAVIAVGEGAIHGAERLDTSLVASDNDGAANHLSRTFLPDIECIALGSDAELAVIASDVIVSISRQGVLHPKESGVTLVALETSPNPQIASKAFQEHQILHNKHETMFEKEYMSAVARTFDYQRDVLQDAHGAHDQTYKPKLYLLFEVLKGGTRKVLKKFLENLCQRINFELSSLDSSGDLPHCLSYARFCLENLGFFDYAQMDEIFHVTSTIESIVLKQSGPVVAHAIEQELLNLRLDPEQGQESEHSQLEQAVDAVNSAGGVPFPAPLQNPAQEPAHQPVQDAIDDARLRHLTVASMILHMMWETRTFIRKQYNISSKLTIKDLQKPATKFALVSGKILWERISSIMKSLESTETMKEECKSFAQLLAIDNEMKVGEDDEDLDERLAAAYDDPDEDDLDDDLPATPRNQKRKSSANIGNTPNKRPRGRSGGSKSKNKTTSRTPDEDGDGVWD